jgi:hypothetical protein
LKTVAHFDHPAFPNFAYCLHFYCKVNLLRAPILVFDKTRKVLKGVEFCSRLLEPSKTWERILCPK